MDEDHLRPWLPTIVGSHSGLSGVPLHSSFHALTTPTNQMVAFRCVDGFSLLHLGFYVLRSIFPWLGQPGSFSSVFFGTVLLALLFNCIPISIGIAMLRYRLWDIDILINRTLVYFALTAILALIYFGLIFVLQSLFEGMFRQNNAVAIVVSTLVIAALFQPLRHRLQRFQAVEKVKEISSTSSTVILCTSMIEFVTR